MDKLMIASPAYGKDYHDGVACRRAWVEGKDFKFSSGGPYFSIRDSEYLRAEGVEHLIINFNRYTDAIHIKL